ncbi:MAG TPA: lipoprotein insertase outer membrane protein LolB [Aquella sp.]|nr:lipoprotein insertase outer membrane protein LolB [Aquella sp.]
MIKIVTATWLFLSITSCAMFYNPTVEKPSPYIKPTAIDQNFDISGRFSIKTSQKNDYGNFTWTKQNESENMELRSPIGSVAAKITIESKIVTLETKDKTYTGDDLDKLLQDNLGFTLPMQSLHYWIQGVALPNTPIDSKLDDGFIQLGWKVEYLDWQDPNHPKILQCSKGDLTIKLLIEW